MLVLIAFFCIAVESIFTALEVAFGAVPRARLRVLLDDEQERLQEERRENGKAGGSSLERRINRALEVQERPERLSLLFLTVTTFTLWTAASLLTWQALQFDWPAWGLPLMLLGVLFGAEVLPLLIAARHPENILLMGGRIVKFSLRLIGPLLAVLGGVALGMSRLFGVRPDATPQVTEGELRSALATAEEEGVIESEERALLEGAMEFRETTVCEVMTPREKITGVAADATLPAVLEIALREGHSRLPVWDGNAAIGIIAAKDLLGHLRHPQRASTIRARDVMRRPIFVPGTQLISATLENLRRQRSLMAVVTGEDGTAIGLVTIEDLLEEIVGEIQDEFDEVL